VRECHNPSFCISKAISATRFKRSAVALHPLVGQGRAGDGAAQLLQCLVLVGIGSALPHAG